MKDEREKMRERKRVNGLLLSECTMLLMLLRLALCKINEGRSSGTMRPDSTRTTTKPVVSLTTTSRVFFQKKALFRVENTIEKISSVNSVSARYVLLTWTKSVVSFLFLFLLSRKLQTSVKRKWRERLKGLRDTHDIAPSIPDELLVYYNNV